MARRTIFASALVLAPLLSIAPSPAEAEDLARAKELFDAGLADMMAGRYDTGCPTLAESYRLSSLPGGVFTLAECEAKWGKLASAQRHYRAYLQRYVSLSPEDRTRQSERKKIATDQIEALERTVPRLTIVLPKGATKPKSITDDGEELALSSLGAPIAFDPGEHRIAVEWSDGTKNEYVRTLSIGGREELLLEPPPGMRGPSGDSGAGQGAAVAADVADPGEGMRTAGYVVGAVGIAGLIAGAITGGAAMSTKQGIEDNCVDTVCTPEGKDAADTTQALGNASTATFIIGGAALATGLILLLAAPSGDEEPAAGDAPAASATSGAVLPWIAVAPGPELGALVGVRSRW